MMVSNEIAVQNQTIDDVNYNPTFKYKIQIADYQLKMFASQKKKIYIEDYAILIMYQPLIP
jgi:hypothetical protein